MLFYDCTDVPISPLICLLLVTSALLTGNLHLQVIDDRRNEDVLICLCAGDHRSEYVPKPKGKAKQPVLKFFAGLSPLQFENDSLISTSTICDEQYLQVLYSIRDLQV